MAGISVSCGMAGSEAELEGNSTASRVMDTPKNPSNKNKQTARSIKLPEREAYTIRQLDKRWEDLDSDEDHIKELIESGKLKQALPLATRNHLQERKFYKCEGEDKQLLDAIRDDEPLSKFTEIRGEFIDCPNYLYMSVESNSIIQTDIHKVYDTLVLIHRIDPDMNPEPFSWKYVEVRYFLDLYGNALILMDGEYIDFMVVRHHPDSLIIPREEVERFLAENTAKRKGKNAESVHKGRGDKILEILKEMGYDPMSLPKSRQGMPGVFGKAKKEYKKRYPDAGQDDFKNAFQWLMNTDKTIAYKE